MNCDDFLKLEEIEKAEYCAKLLHVCTSDDSLFKNGKDLIELGERKGLLDKVKIGREIINHQTTTECHNPETKSNASNPTNE